QMLGIAELLLGLPTGFIFFNPLGRNFPICLCRSVIPIDRKRVNLIDFQYLASVFSPVLGHLDRDFRIWAKTFRSHTAAVRTGETKFPPLLPLWTWGCSEIEVGSAVHVQQFPRLRFFFYSAVGKFWGAGHRAILEKGLTAS